MGETPYTRARDEAKRMYVEGEIDEEALEVILEDAMVRREALESPGQEWARFAEDHGLSEIRLLSSFEAENMMI